MGLQPPELGKCAACIGPGHDRAAQMSQPVEDRREGLHQRRGNQHRFRTAVLEHVGVLLRREQRIERHRDDAGADRAPERDREIHGIEQDEDDAALLAQSERPQAAAEPAGGGLQFAVAQRALRVGEGDFVGEAALDIGVDEIGHRIIGAPRPRCVHRTSP